MNRERETLSETCESVIARNMCLANDASHVEFADFWSSLEKKTCGHV